MVRCRSTSMARRWLGCVLSIVGRAQRSVRRVELIVDSLWRFAQARDRPDPSSWSDLRTVIEHVCDDLQPIADAASVKLTLRPVPARKWRAHGAASW